MMFAMAAWLSCVACGATARAGEAACAKCGKPLATRPSTGGMAVPDLDMPAPRAARPQPQAGARVSQPKMPVAARPEPIPSVAPTHGEIDVAALGDDEGDVSLNLDLGAGPPLVSGAGAGPAPIAPAASRASDASDAGRDGRTRVSSGGAPHAPLRAPGPEGSAPHPVVRVDPATGAEIALDPFEVKALADYGDPPEAWWKAPLYAYRVLTRRPELRKLAAAKTREAERTRGAHEDALAAFAEVARPQAEKLGAYAGALDQVRAAEMVLRQRDATLAAEADAHKQRAAQFEAKLAELEAQLAQMQIEERAIAGELAESDALLKRAEARAKHAEIEIRNALAEVGAAEAPKVEP